jgi:hypothetical protein
MPSPLQKFLTLIQELGFREVDNVTTIMSENTYKVFDNLGSTIVRFPTFSFVFDGNGNFKYNEP